MLYREMLIGDLFLRPSDLLSGQYRCQQTVLYGKKYFTFNSKPEPDGTNTLIKINIIFLRHKQKANSNLNTRITIQF